MYALPKIVRLGVVNGNWQSVAESPYGRCGPRSHGGGSGPGLPAPEAGSASLYYGTARRAVPACPLPIMAGGGTRGRKVAGVFTPPCVPVVSDALRFLARGIGGKGNLVARQSLQGKIRHLSNL